MPRALFSWMLAAAGIALSLPSAVAAQPPADCSTPRRATRTFLANLPPNAERPSIAIACFDWGAAGVPESEREALAIKLKAVLDLEGWWVKIDEMPDVPEPEGLDRYTLADELQEVYVEKVGTDWLISASSVGAINRIYAAHVNEAVEQLLERLPAWLKQKTVLDVAWWQLFGVIVLLLLAIALRTIVAHLIAGYGSRILQQQGDRADGAIVDKAARPIATLMMAGLLWQLLPYLRFGPRFNAIGYVALRVVAASAAVMVAYRLVDLASDIFARRAEKTETKLDDQLIPLVRKAIKVFVVALGVIFVLQNMDVDVGSLIAGASLGGLAFTLAARDTVANLFGSISIFADQPFQVGDWVVIDGTEGIVQEVGMRSTRILTFYNSVVSLPNSKIANAVIDNYGMRRYRRCFVTLGLTYSTTPDQMQAFCEGVRAILRANPRVRQDAYEVHFRDFGSSSLEVMVYFFFEVNTWTDELTERHNVFLEILRLAKEIGVSFAFPTQTLHVETLAKAQEQAHPAAPSRDELRPKVVAFGPQGELSQAQGRQLTDDGYFPRAPG